MTRSISLALTLAVVALCAGCAHLKTNVSPVADVANAAGKVEETGQQIFKAVVAAREVTPNLVSQQAADAVAIAVNKLGHAGLTLGDALKAYNAAKAAGGDLTAQRAVVQQALAVVEQFLAEIGRALPPGTLQTVDALANVILDVILRVKAGVGL